MSQAEYLSQGMNKVY